MDHPGDNVARVGSEILPFPEDIVEPDDGMTQSPLLRGTAKVPFHCLFCNRIRGDERRIARRSVETLLHFGGIADIYRIYLTAVRDGVEFRLATMSSVFNAPRAQPCSR